MMEQEPSSAQQRLEQLAHESVGRLLWRYSLPAVAGMVVVSLYNVVDRILIGQAVGPDAIAGLAVTLPVMNLSAALGVLIGGGASARISILLGAGDSEGAHRVLGNSLVLTLIIGLIYVTCFYIWLDPILRMFGASEATLPYAREFMEVLVPGLLIVNLALSFNSCMRASGYPMLAMITNFIGAVINIPLVALFIYGFGWGIRGSAVATVIAMTVSCIFVMAHFFNKKSTVHFRRGIYGLRWRVVLGIMAIGAAPSLINAAASAVNAIVNNSLLRYGGDLAVAAAGIFTSLASIGVMTMSGIAQGMQPIVGYNYGAGNIARMKRAFYYATAGATAVALVCSVVGMTIPGLWARCFTTSDHLIGVTVNCLRLSFWAFWTVGLQVIATTFFQSIGKAGKSVFLSLSRQVIFLIPMLMWLPHYLQLDGVWLSFPIGDICATIASAALIFWQWPRFHTPLSR